MEDIKRIAEETGKAFSEYRKLNDERLAALEKKGHNDPLIDEHLARLDKRFETLETQLEELAKKQGRSGLPGGAGDPNPEEAEYTKEFDSFMRSGVVGDRMQKKTLTVGDDTAAGWLVPEALNMAIRDRVQLRAVMRSLATVVGNGSEKYEELIDVGGESSGWVGELDSRTDTNNPSLVKVAPSFGEIYAMPSTTQKLLDDSAIDVEAWLARAVVRDFVKKEDVAFLSGDGVNKPKGILSYSLDTADDDTRAADKLQKVASGQSADFDTDDLIDLISALDDSLLGNARFLMKKSTVTKVRKFKDDVLGYLWQPSIQAGIPPTLLGYPLETSGNMPAVGSATKPVLFGDFKAGYMVMDVRGVRVLRDNLTTKGKVKFYTTRRLGGGVMDFQAIKVLELGA